jgi:hypothetical protein
VIDPAKFAEVRESPANPCVSGLFSFARRRTSWATLDVAMRLAEPTREGLPTPIAAVREHPI